MDALSRGNHWVKPDGQRPGELWIRFELDWVPLWKSHVVAGTLAPCSHLRDLKHHSLDRHFVCMLFRGYDATKLLKHSLQKSGYLGSVDNLNGSCVTINGTHYVVRLFICGDHMLMYKLTSRDGPTSTRPERHPCPYCAAPAPDVLNYAAQVLAMSFGAEAMFVGIHAIGCSHGMVNVLYGVCLPVVGNMLIECGWTKKDVNDYCGTLNVDPMSYVVGGEVTGDGLPPSIDNAFTFFEKRCYNPIDTTLKLVCHDIIRLDGQDYSKSDLIAGMFEHVAIMVSVAYTPEPTLSQVDNYSNRHMCETSARALRRWMHRRHHGAMCGRHMYHSSYGYGERCFLSSATALRDIGGTSRLRFGIVLMGTGKVPRVDLKRFCRIVLSVGCYGSLALPCMVALVKYAKPALGCGKGIIQRLHKAGTKQLLSGLP